NAGAAVFDGDRHFGIDRFTRESNLSAGRGLKRVLDEVRNRAANQSRVAGELRWRRCVDVRTKRDAALGAVGVIGRELLEQFFEIERTAMYLPQRCVIAELFRRLAEH